MTARHEPILKSKVVHAQCIFLKERWIFIFNIYLVSRRKYTGKGGGHLSQISQNYFLQRKDVNVSGLATETPVTGITLRESCTLEQK